MSYGRSAYGSVRYGAAPATATPPPASSARWSTVFIMLSLILFLAVEVNMQFYDTAWYPMILVGRTGTEFPKEIVKAASKITKTIKAPSPITKIIKVRSTVIP